jgi:hypothetical protein
MADLAGALRRFCEFTDFPPHYKIAQRGAMKPYVKKLIVLAAGYIAALVIAVAAVALRIKFLSGPDEEASSGMYAFGDALLFVTVFSICALVPSGAALFFLRPYRRFWLVFSALVVAVAVTGVPAAYLFQVGREPTASAFPAWDVFLVLRLLVAPLLALTFLVCTALSPYRFARVALAAASALETAVSAYAGWVWFIPLVFDR